jgi:hypothetical protein
MFGDPADAHTANRSRRLDLLPVGDARLEAGDKRFASRGTQVSLQMPIHHRALGRSADRFRVMSSSSQSSNVECDDLQRRRAPDACDGRPRRLGGG